MSNKETYDYRQGSRNKITTKCIYSLLIYLKKVKLFQKPKILILWVGET